MRVANLTLEWINKDAVQGPVFRIGPDVYSREWAGARVVRLDAKVSYTAEQADLPIRAFKELAEHWRAPIVFIIDPDLSKPPAVQFLYRWSLHAYANGSVERSFMAVKGPLQKWMAGIVLRAFSSAEMPFEALTEGELSARLAGLDLSCGREGFATREMTTALALRGEDDAFTQLAKRVLRKITRGS